MTQSAVEKEIGSDGKSWPETLDADAWARQFKRLIKTEADENLLTTWFSNAIMRGFDKGYWSGRKTIDASA